MNSEIAIKVENLSKKYFIAGSKERISLAEGIVQFFKRKKKTKEEFFALKNISFEIKKGETVGIIGRNGAGKSTLLKILSRITEPSEGRIEIYGTLASVLEVGMGFHPEFSGRENVFLSGSMMGIPREQIEAKFDEIVEFAGVQKFIDSPVKHYLSGMYVRLAFSVVANIDADILLFDEVLSVGDMAFQIKCNKKIRELVVQKKTILLVSHNMNDIMNLCNKVLYLESGKIEQQGRIDIIKEYFEKSFEDVKAINVEETKNEKNKRIHKNILSKDWEEDGNLVDSGVKLKKLFVQNITNPNSESFYSDNKIAICIEYEKIDDYTFYDLGIFVSSMNNLLIAAHTLHSDIDITKNTKKGHYLAVAIFDEDFFNETIIEIGFSITKNNQVLLYYDFNLLKIKINLRIKEHEIEYFNNISKFVGPIRTKIEWEIIKKQ